MNENEIVRLIQRRFRGKSASVICGIGDDAAVLRPPRSPGRWVLTTDMLLEQIDFRAEWITPAQLGHKALAVNLSDLAAMGATPRFFTVALALPANVTKSWIESFYRGMAKLARRYGAVLIGGDLSRSPAGIQVTITAIGETFIKKPVYRAGGQPGDLLYVTGILGRAAAGLDLLMRGQLQGKSSSERQAVKAQLMPEPRCEAGIWLAHSGFVHCMMDLSDGLSIDLPRLCKASSVGAEIYSEQLPVFRQAWAWQLDPVALALNGGEDFELLFAVPPRKAQALEERYAKGLPSLTRIGRLRRNRGVVWAPRPGAASRPLIPAGFDHFRSPEKH